MQSRAYQCLSLNRARQDAQVTPMELDLLKSLWVCREARSDAGDMREKTLAVLDQRCEFGVSVSPRPINSFYRSVSRYLAFESLSAVNAVHCAEIEAGREDSVGSPSMVIYVSSHCYPSKCHSRTGPLLELHTAASKLETSKMGTFRSL